MGHYNHMGNLHQKINFQKIPRGSLLEQAVLTPVWAISNPTTTKTSEIKLMPLLNHFFSGTKMCQLAHVLGE